MAGDHFQRARDIFHDISQLPASDQAAAIDQRCAGDEDLKREVSSLLAAGTAAGEFLGASPLGVGLRDIAGQIAEPEAILGQRVGAYVLTALIGSGGMGSVYRGERGDDEFSKVVAIKILHDELSTPELRARFHRERQVLADLEHPHIARLYDCGVTTGGRPYIVMEYVQGLPLDAHCNRENLHQKQRINLFQDVCRAVQHAHRNLVVHRDLKPGNILVDQSGSVKLLDFGIAEVMDHPSDQQARHLQSFTPRFASPEQHRGAATTTATDVYALGVVLRLLLTGAAEGVLTPLPPELQAIIAQATHQDPDQRYESVKHLADDLAHFHNHQPVLAVPQTAAYRSRKFLRRNRAAVVWASCLAGLLVGATVVSVRLAMRANEQEALARQRFDEVHDLANHLPI